MQTYNTISGKPTRYGRKGSNIDSIVFDLEQQERLRQHYERKKQNLSIPKIKVKDEELDEWLAEELKLKKEVEKEGEWE